MLRAVYYPHTAITSRELLKTALLLWDGVECIVPWAGWDPTPRIQSRVYQEAHDIIFRPHKPIKKEMQAVDAAVRDFIESGASDAFFRAVAQDHFQESRYLIYPQKFLHSTWETLQREGLAEWDAPSADFDVPVPLAFLMMSLLASVCAGTQKQLITDRVDAYGLLQQRISQTVGGTYVEGLDPSQVAPNSDRLVTLSLDVLDGRKIPIRNLIRLRKQEAKESGSDLRAFRVKYAKALQACLKRISEEARTEGDVREIERQLREEMKHDLKDLKKALRAANIDLLFSKEMAVSAVALAGGFAEPISGVTHLATTLKGVGVTALVKKAAGFKAARRKALKGHTMSWLYLTRRGRRTAI